MIAEQLLARVDVGLGEALARRRLSRMSPSSTSAKRSSCRVSATGNSSSTSICSVPARSGRSALPS